MFKYRYTNPNAGLYRAEYAMYTSIAGLFAKVSCRSMALDSIRLYYAELSEKGKKELDKEIMYLVDRYVKDKVCFPAMSICRAEVKIRAKADGSHSFTFTDGVYSFRVSLKYSGQDKKAFIKIEDPGKPDPGK